MQNPVSRARQFQLRVSDLHELFVEEVGNPDGIPIVFLHGGPGGGTSPAQLLTFDPAKFRIISYDQRGAGRSTPVAEIRENTTWALVSDLEHIRETLGIERWFVAGGSWGSCLALAYGEAHPERCLGFRLHGVFLISAAEIDWWFNGSRMIFPDHWEAFASFIPEDERHDLLGAYYRRLTCEDRDTCVEAAISLRRFSASTQTFLPDENHVRKLVEPAAALAVSRLFTHYCINGGFLEPDQLLKNIGRIRHLPCEIVQARYDTVTPMASAWAVSRAWPNARFTIVTEANHQSTHGPMAEALREAADRLSLSFVGATHEEQRCWSA